MKILYVSLGIALVVLARLALQLTDHFVLHDRSVGHWLGRAVRAVRRASKAAKARWQQRRK